LKGELNMGKLLLALLVLTLLLGITASALAQEDVTNADNSGGARAAAIQYFIWVVVICGAAMAVAAVGAAIAQSQAARQALEAVARQPEASGKLQVQMMLALIFIETLAIYTLVVDLILLFINPFTDTVVKLSGM
jgi:F-type H+-transporting ATPase subunit c